MSDILPFGALSDFKETYVARADGSDSAKDTADKHVRRLWRFQQFQANRGTDLYGEVDIDEFMNFRQYLRDEHDLGEGSVKNHSSAVSKFFQLERSDDSNPVREWEPSDDSGKWSTTTDKERQTREKVHYLDKPDVQALLENVPDPQFRSSLIIRLLVSTGMRRSELVTLRLRDVDPDAKELMIRDEKTDDYRTVAFRDPKLARSLRIWIDHERAKQFGAMETEYLFPPGDGSGSNDHISPSTVERTVKVAAENAGIQETYTTTNGQETCLVTPHCLRATFAVQCAKADVSAPFVKEALGHHDISVTDLYLSVTGDDANDVIREQGPSF